MKNIIFPLLFILNISCAKVEISNPCDTKEPTKELKWMSDFISNANSKSQKIKIYKAILKDKSKKINKKLEAFLIQTGSITTYYNCSGDKICESGGFVGTVCDKYETIQQEIIFEN